MSLGIRYCHTSALAVKDTLNIFFMSAVPRKKKSGKQCFRSSFLAKIHRKVGCCFRMITLLLSFFKPWRTQVEPRLAEKGLLNLGPTQPHARYSAFNGMWHSHEFFFFFVKNRYYYGINRCPCPLVWRSWLIYSASKTWKENIFAPGVFSKRGQLFNPPPQKDPEKIAEEKPTKPSFRFGLVVPGKVRPKERAKEMHWRVMQEICPVGSRVGQELVKNTGVFFFWRAIFFWGVFYYVLPFGVRLVFMKCCVLASFFFSKWLWLNVIEGMHQWYLMIAEMS